MRRASVPFPAAAGPSMAMTGFVDERDGPVACSVSKAGTMVA